MSLRVSFRERTRFVSCCGNTTRPGREGRTEGWRRLRRTDGLLSISNPSDDETVASKGTNDEIDAGDETMEKTAAAFMHKC